LDGLKDLGSSSYSWPGEILSTSDVEVHPVREGQIAEWRVKLGQTVKKGQIRGAIMRELLKGEKTLVQIVSAIDKEKEKVKEVLGDLVREGMVGKEKGKYGVK
jgi:hypothetical protein